MGEKILVVDDEPLILRTIERALSKKGYDVRLATDAEGFLRALEQEPAELLLMDMNLAGVHADSLMERVRQLAPNAKVVFMSGRMAEHDGIWFIEKPFTLDELRSTIRLALDGTPPPVPGKPA